jgi:hypothetical protein
MSAERKQRVTDKPWSRLEQALKATDLLLQAGGFAAIVLDMSDVLPQHTMRIPLGAWYRFRLAAEEARTALIFLTQAPCVGSCAALALRCEPSSVTRFSNDDETALFERQQYTLVRERNRNEGSPLTLKKPSMRAEWRAENVYLRDSCVGATGCTVQNTLVSLGNDGSIANSGCHQQSMSADGRHIAFTSIATNLVWGIPYPAGSWQDIYVRDTCTGAPTGCYPSTVRVAVTNTPYYQTPSNAGASLPGNQR